MSIQTEFDFTLPRGFVDASGRLHRQGRMRLATALDEIQALDDGRVQANAAYMPVVLLSRVIVQLGELTQISPQMIERLFASDVAYLEDLYLRLNTHESTLLGVQCPHCGQRYEVQVAPLGGVSAVE